MAFCLSALVLQVLVINQYYSSIHLNVIKQRKVPISLCILTGKYALYTFLVNILIVVIFSCFFAPKPNPIFLKMSNTALVNQLSVSAAMHEPQYLL